LVPGDTATIRVIASNPTGRTLQFRTNSCVLGVRILDRAGHPVFQNPTTCNDIGLLHDLAPNEFIEQVFVFDGTTTWGPFLDENGREARVFLAPGVYQVFGGITADLVNASPHAPLRILATP
jgi:hypothetical protein